MGSSMELIGEASSDTLICQQLYTPRSLFSMFQLSDMADEWFNNYQPLINIPVYVHVCM